MQSDSLFYELFHTSPQVFFELIGTTIPQSGLYSMVSQKEDVTAQARQLIARTHAEEIDPTGQRSILELIQTIFIY